MLNLLNFFKKFKILLVQVWFVLQSIHICDSFLHKKTPFTLLKYFSSEFINIDWILVSFTDWRKKKKKIKSIVSGLFENCLDQLY